MSHTSIHPESNALASGILKKTDVHVQKCYQCGKCTAGCPVADEMDIAPSMAMRLLQTEDARNDDEILRSHTIWLCLACEMCLSRCPMQIDIPSMMDYLRQRSVEEKKVNRKAKNIISFHKSFLNSIKLTGRLYELGLIIDYKRRSLNMTQDVMLAPKMISRGKLHLFPDMIRDRAHLKKIFKKTGK